MNKTTERYFNLMALFQTLRIEKALTQAELKERHSLHASTVSYLVNDLRSLGLVKNSEKIMATGRVGKPGQLIELNNDLSVFLGLYIEETFVDIHVIGLADNEISSSRIPAQVPTHDLPDFVIDLIHEQLACYGPIRGIGIAVKSVVDAEGNLSSFKRRINGVQENRIWQVQGFAEKIRSAFSDIIVIVENDANCAAVYCQAAAKHTWDTSIVFVVNVHPFGIGSGVIIDGALFRGHNGAAGEFFFPDRNIQDLAEKGDTKADVLMSSLRESIIKEIYFIDPEMIYLTGSLFSELSEHDIRHIQSWFSEIPYHVEILSEEQYSLPAKGAVLLAADEYIAELFKSIGRRRA